MTDEADDLPDEAYELEGDPEGKDHEQRVWLREVVERYGEMDAFWNKIFIAAMEDDRFRAGKQWPDQIQKDREEDGRPCLTYNMMRSFVRQIVNKIRQDRPRLKVRPVETNKSSKGRMPLIKNMAGTKDYSMADVYGGIWKNIEHISRADQAYDTAVDHAAGHGFGWFYMINEYSPTDPWVQILKIYRVKNSYSVMLDPDAQEADYRDAQDGFIFTDIRRSTFKKKWPNASVIGFSTGSELGVQFTKWLSTDSVRVAQYFWIEWREDETIKLSNGKICYLSEVEPVLDELKQQLGIHIEKDDQGNELRKAVRRPVCRWAKITATDVLEGPIDLPFSAVPIFFVAGDEEIVDNETSYVSAIRDAKDAQRSYNYWRTAAAETVALQPKAPWLITAAQIEGHEAFWKSANKKNLPYLPYNFKENHPAPQRIFPTGAAAAELQNATQDAIDMQTIIGLHDASLGRESNEKSGKAIIARQNQGNTATYQFPDNLSRAIMQAGRLAVEAIPKLYDTARIERIYLPNGDEDFVELNTAMRDEETNETVLIHDIAYGAYDVVMDTGPSYATQLQEAADLQLDLLKVLGPDRAANIVHLIVKNMNVPGADEVYQILRKMLPDALKTTEEREADLPPGITLNEQGQPVDADGNPWQPPPTVEQQIAQKEQELREMQYKAEQAKHQATMAKAEADKAEAKADVEKLRLEIGAKRQELQQLGQQQAAQGVDMGEIARIVKEAMEQHQADPKAHGEAIKEAVAEGVTEALKRVRSYVDTSLKPLVAANNGGPNGQQSESGGQNANG